jgi:putative transposase
MLDAPQLDQESIMGNFPNDAAITRLVGAMLLEQYDEWCLNRRYRQLESLQSLSHGRPEAALAHGRPSATPR